VSKHLRGLLLAVLLGVAVYAAFALYAGFAKLGASLRAFAWGSFAAACALALGNYLLRFLKWELYLARLGIRGVPKLDSLLVFLSGFVLTVTPGKVGEVFKSLLLFGTHRVSIARTAPIIVAERLTDLVGVVVLIVVGSFWTGGLLWAGIGAALAVACLVVIMSRRVSGALVRLAARMPGPFRRLSPKLEEAWDSLRLMTSPGALGLPSLLSVAAWALEGVALWVILEGFGASVGPGPALFFYATATLAGALTPVPGGLGVTEGALEEQMRRLGDVAQPVATASMMLVRVATLWFAVLVGFVALALLRARHPALLQRARESGPGEP
jgi:uncharacterized protein (TIRG00374 family)